jgi:hypothetical protein
LNFVRNSLADTRNSIWNIKPKGLLVADSRAARACAPVFGNFLRGLVQPIELDSCQSVMRFAVYKTVYKKWWLPSEK